MIEYNVKVYDKEKHWFLNGKLHREDGPAVKLFWGSNNLKRPNHL